MDAENQWQSSHIWKDKNPDFYMLSFLIFLWCRSHVHLCGGCCYSFLVVDRIDRRSQSHRCLIKCLWSDELISSLINGLWGMRRGGWGCNKQPWNKILQIHSWMGSVCCLGFVGAVSGAEGLRCICDRIQHQLLLAVPPCSSLPSPPRPSRSTDTPLSLLTGQHTGPLCHLSISWTVP